MNIRGPVRAFFALSTALLFALAPVAITGCQSSTGVYVATETPHDYRLTFRAGSHLDGPASFHAILTLAGGRELWVSLDAANGELAAFTALHWSDWINARAVTTAEPSSNTIVLRRVLQIELRAPLRGLKLRDLGESF